jgi:hypothetical protein
MAIADSQRCRPRRFVAATAPREHSAAVHHEPRDGDDAQQQHDGDGPARRRHRDRARRRHRSHATAFAVDLLTLPTPRCRTEALPRCKEEGGAESETPYARVAGWLRGGRGVAVRRVVAAAVYHMHSCVTHRTRRRTARNVSCCPARVLPSSRHCICLSRRCRRRTWPSTCLSLW